LEKEEELLLFISFVDIFDLFDKQFDDNSFELILFLLCCDNVDEFDEELDEAVTEDEAEND